MNEYIPSDDLKRVLSTPHGRKVLYAILGLGGVFRQPFVAGDPEATAFNCGSLNIGIILHAECMTASPDFTARMYKEQSNESRTEQPADNSGSKRPEPGSEQPDLLDPLGLGFDRSWQ